MSGPYTPGPLPNESALWAVLRTTPNPLAILEGVHYALDTGEDDLDPLLPEDRRTLGSIVEFMVNRIGAEGL